VGRFVSVDGYRDGAYHGAHLPPHPARRAVWSAIADYLAPWIAPSAHVLEIGAGCCDWINAVRAARRVAVDLWEETPRYAAPGVEAHRMNAAEARAAFGDQAFDVVLASNVLEHFEPDAAAALAADVFALLRPAGRFLVVQPNFRHCSRSYFDDFTHRAVFTDVSLPNMLRSRGFAIEDVRPKFLPYSMRNLRGSVPGWLVAAYLRSPFKPAAGQMLVIARRH
jgi:cyclopropane fatty-acyl-phospholipid synthase-like methyltransferase